MTEPNANKHSTVNRGPRSRHPSGRGYTTAKGYHRVYCRKQRRYRLMHNIVWEQHNGPIPDGHDIHHVNEDKQDNRIENLQLLSKAAHKRIHGGCEQRDGVWWKPCSVCNKFKPIDIEHWYISKEGWPLYGRCRKCHIAKVVAAKRMRKLRKA